MNLYKVAHHPRGTVPNPAAAPVLPASGVGLPAPPPGIPLMIANPSIYISMQAKRYLQLTVLVEM